MRKHVKVATLSLAVFAGACGTSKEQSATLPEDLQKDLAAASAPASDLATAPKSFEPTRFVSEMERRGDRHAGQDDGHDQAADEADAASAAGEQARRGASRTADVAGTSEMAPSTTRAPVPADLPTIPEPIATAPEPGARPAPSPVPPAGGSGDGGIGERRRGAASAGWAVSSAGSSAASSSAAVMAASTSAIRVPTVGRGGIFIMGPNSGMPLPTGTFPRRLTGTFPRF